MRHLQIKTLNSHLHVRNKIAIGRGKQSGTRADWGNGQRGFKESFLSLLRMHWDHEPWKAPASRTHSKRFAKSQALGHCAAAFGVRGACSRLRTRFMESRHSIASAPEEADCIRPNVGQASRLPRARASASGMTSVPQASPLGGR